MLLRCEDWTRGMLERQAVSLPWPNARVRPWGRPQHWEEERGLTDADAVVCAAETSSTAGPPRVAVTTAAIQRAGRSLLRVCVGEAWGGTLGQSLPGRSGSLRPASR